MIQTITSLKGAVVTLGKAHGESLMQVRQVLERISAKHQHLLTHQGGALALLQQGTSIRARTPASGEIFGMLKQMKESFETNLASARKEEEQGVAEYAQLKEAKTKELGAATDQAENKKIEKADAEEGGAQAAQDLKDTTAQLKADEEFLADMTPKCDAADKEYEARVKVR